MKLLFSVLTILVAVIGAGFATGEEVRQFFGALNGFFGIFIVFVFACLFCFLTYAFLNIKKQDNKFFNLFALICFVVVSSTMVAGFKEMFLSSKIIFAILFLLVACVIVFFSSSLVIKSLKLISPFVILVFIVICLIFILNKPIIFEVSGLNFIKQNIFLKLANIFIYVLANLFLICELLISMNSQFNKKEKWIISISSSLFITVFLVLIMLILNIETSATPVLILAKKYGGVIKVIYEAVLLLSIFSTLLSTLLGMKKTSQRLFNFKNEKHNTILFCSLIVLVFLMSFVSFSSLIKLFMPIESILGLIFLIASQKKFQWSKLKS